MQGDLNVCKGKEQKKGLKCGIIYQRHTAN